MLLVLRSFGYVLARMRHTDIAIAGGGLAGSAAAAMLARRGLRVVLVDPHAIYPPDFRCEKLDGPQIKLLEQTGLAQAVLPAATFDGSVWIAQGGLLVEKRPSDQYGILYDSLVNCVRAAIPPFAEFIPGKVVKVTNGPELQTIVLSSGEQISARLVVIANGLNVGLRQKLGIAHQTLCGCHSITIGFDVEPAGRAGFDFRALTYYTENVATRIAYLTLFPIGARMRANLFVYRDLGDPWLRDMRERPREALAAVMPNLTRVTGDLDLKGPITIRPADLYVATGYRQPGIVLIGDAFSTSCPAAGTGVRKVFTDTERLCNVHIPRWLDGPGMGQDKIATFYEDPVKRACDTHSARKATYMRAMSTEPAYRWCARRGIRFAARLSRGTLRQAQETVSTFLLDRHKSDTRNNANG